VIAALSSWEDHREGRGVCGRFGEECPFWGELGDLECVEME
jgi:hypothetical protein